MKLCYNISVKDKTSKERTNKTMTRKEFIEKIQNQTEVPIYGNDELEERLSGFWITKYWKENLNIVITNYEIMCDYPLYKVMKIFNDYNYANNKHNTSLEEWLGENATDEFIEKYFLYKDEINKYMNKKN